MAHMGCDCGSDMWDGDGHIVYDVYKVNDFRDYIKEHDEKCTFGELYDEFTPITEECPAFWLCDDCKTAHLWVYSPKYCARTFKLSKISSDISIDEIKKLEEYLIFNLNDDYYDFTLAEIIEKNPIRPYKYYVKEDLTKVYIVNINKDEIDRIYDLTYESFVEYNYDVESFDNLLIYTIDKVNDDHEYEVKNGKRIQIDSDDFPHKQVNFMITENGNNGGSVSYADPNLKPETYNIHTMNEFYNKYGKYYLNK